jgi:hypothetical protein
MIDLRQERQNACDFMRVNSESDSVETDESERQSEKHDKVII